MSAWLLRAWAWLPREWPLVSQGKAARRARATFLLGVDAGASGLVQPSQPLNVRHLTGLPSGVVGVEIPPR